MLKGCMGRDYGGAREGVDVAAPLLPASTSAVYATSRSRKDVGWMFAWLVVFLGSIGSGVYFYLNRNTRFLELITPEHMNEPGSCPRPPPGALRGRLQGDDDDRGDPIQLDDFLHHAVLWIAASVLGALVVGLLFLALVRSSPRAMVLLTIGLQVGLPAAAAGGSLAVGAWQPAVGLLVLTGLTALVFILWHEQVQLVTALLGVSGRALSSNLGLVPASLAIQAGLMALLLPQVVAIVAGVTNGRLVPNPERMQDDADKCVNESGESVMCCAWKLDNSVPLLEVFICLSLLWTTFLAAEVRTFTVAGAVSQWYFSPVSLVHKARSRTLQALRHALGPSFGSLCLGSAILTAVNIMRQALESLRKKAEENILLYCLFVALQVLYSLVEYVTKFTTVRMAITGEAFFDAGRNVVDLLKRNFMDAFGVWWLPPMILHSCIFILSLAWSAAMYFISNTAWSSLHQGSQYALLLAIIAFCVCWAVLSFFGSLLFNIIDTVFVCFAMDRDMAAVTMVEVHEVYRHLPTVGPVVQNPDGAYAYGAPRV